MLPWWFYLNVITIISLLIISIKELKTDVNKTQAWLVLLLSSVALFISILRFLGTVLIN